MILDKFKNLQIIKTLSSVRKKSKNVKTNTIKKAPHSISCEVLFCFNGYIAKTKHKEYPLKITEDDYKQAIYAYSNIENLHWNPYTLKRFKYNYYYSNYLKKYWILIKPNIKAYIIIKDNIAYLDMIAMNNKHEKLLNKLTFKYYATNRRD